MCVVNVKLEGFRNNPYYTTHVQNYFRREDGLHGLFLWDKSFYCIKKDTLSKKILIVSVNNIVLLVGFHDFQIGSVLMGSLQLISMTQKANKRKSKMSIEIFVDYLELKIESPHFRFISIVHIQKIWQNFGNPSIKKLQHKSRVYIAVCEKF